MLDVDGGVSVPPGQKDQGNQAPPTGGAQVVSLVPRTRSASNPGRQPRSKADKQAVERDYRTTALTLMELEKLHGVPASTIQRWSQINRWTRPNFDAMVEEKTQAILAERAAGVERPRQDKPGRKVVKDGLSDQERAKMVAAKAADTVTQIAEVNAQVISRHRSDIQDTRGLVMRLVAELEATTMNQETLREFFDMVTGIAGEEGKTMSPQTRQALRQQLAEFMRLHSRVASVAKLSDALARLQGLERQAHDMDKEQKKPPPAIPSVADLDPKKAHETYHEVVQRAA